MAVTLTLCASRMMPSSICLLPMPLEFHCSMLNVLSDMVGVWAGLGGGEDVPCCGGVLQVVQILPLALRYSATFRMYQMRASCTQVAGALASDVLEADRAGVPWRSCVRVHITG